jgi:phycocyanobilin lyase alpha subunit
MESPDTSGAPQLTKEQALHNLRQTEDLGLRYYAAWWLGKFRVQDPAAVEVLLVALEDEADRSPDGGYPLRRNAARALGKLADSRAVPALIESLDCSDFYVRKAAAESLEMLGDKAAIPALSKLLEGGIAAAKKVEGKPHLTQPYEAIIEALGTLGATESIELIEPFLEHPVNKVRYATARAMYQLTNDPIYAQKLVQGLQETSLPLKRSVLMDLGAIGYVPAADAIAQTLVENSMKLISLKGLLEHELTQQSDLSAESVRLMEIMDSLL